MRRSPMEIFNEIDSAADSIRLSPSNPLSMTEGLPTTKAPIPWRRRINPWPSNARIASRKVARETPSCCANNGSEGRRSPGAVFSMSSASTTCNRWYGWIFSVIILSLILDYWNKFELYDIHNTQVGNAQLRDDHQGHQAKLHIGVVQMAAASFKPLQNCRGFSCHDRGRLAGNQSGNWPINLADSPPILDHHLPAAAGCQFIDGLGHQSIIGADDNHVMAVMCHSGGNGGGGSKTKALN